MTKRWADAELRFLKDNAEKMSVQALADALTVRIDELEKKMKSLGLLGGASENLIAKKAQTLKELSKHTENARKDYRERWAKWWGENGDKVDLARVEQDPPQRGWTVIAQMSTSKVYELDRQGKVRWTIEDLSGPIDAQLLPGDLICTGTPAGCVLGCMFFQTFRTGSYVQVSAGRSGCGATYRTRSPLS